MINTENELEKERSSTIPPPRNSYFIIFECLFIFFILPKLLHSEVIICIYMFMVFFIHLLLYVHSPLFSQFYWDIMDIKHHQGVQHNDYIYIYFAKWLPWYVCLKSITLHSYKFFCFLWWELLRPTLLATFKYAI